MKISYNLYFKSGDIESITKYRYRTKEEAIDIKMRLNNELILKGYTDREYVVYKVTKEEVYSIY